MTSADLLGIFACVLSVLTTAAMYANSRIARARMDEMEGRVNMLHAMIDHFDKRLEAMEK